MSAHCQVTGRSPGFGNRVSHSQRRTRRTWKPNIQTKTYYLPSEDRTRGSNDQTAGQREGHQGHRPRRHRGRGGETATRRSENLMVRNEIRPVVKLRSTAGTGYTYITRKNRPNDPDRLTLRKYDPMIRRHVDFREKR